MKLFIKWTVLVFLSALVSLVLATLNNTNGHHILGMCLGIFTFILLYYFVDLRLQKSSRSDLRKYLLQSVYIKMALQLIPFLEFFAGMMSGFILESFKHLSGIELGFNSSFPIITSYIMTVLVGIQLSLVVGVLFLIIKFFKTRNKRQHAINEI